MWRARPWRRGAWPPRPRSRVQVAQQRDDREGERARAVNEHGLRAGRGRREQDGAQRDADRVGQHGSLVGDAVRNGEQLGDVRGEALGVRSGGCRTVPEVDRGRQAARTEVSAPRVAAVPAGSARRVDAAGNAGQPRIEDDALACVQAPPDDLMAEHVRKGHERGERVVAGAVQQDLLHVGAAQAGEGRLDAHPVFRRKRLLRDVLDADGRETGDEGPPVHPAADGRSRLTREAVPEHERLHIDPPIACHPYTRNSRPVRQNAAVFDRSRDGNARWQGSPHHRGRAGAGTGPRGDLRARGRRRDHRRRH